MKSNYNCGNAPISILRSVEWLFVYNPGTNSSGSIEDTRKGVMSVRMACSVRKNDKVANATF